MYRIVHNNLVSSISVMSLRGSILSICTFILLDSCVFFHKSVCLYCIGCMNVHIRHWEKYLFVLIISIIVIVIVYNGNSKY